VDAGGDPLGLTAQAPAQASGKPGSAPRHLRHPLLATADHHLPAGPATPSSRRPCAGASAPDGARATFFQVGRNVSYYPYLTRRAYLRGNSVQNHTWSHVDLRYVSRETFKYQVRKTDSYIRAQTGYTPRCLRPPYGAVNSRVYDRAAALGKKIRIWTVDPRDWSRPGTSVIVRRVLGNVHSGSIVLLHDGGGDRSQTVAALPTILKTLKARGYVFYRLWCR
jgi:peptidoglycan/xylan/chitin deacetylase (PgdA/CDA1 family)